MVSFDGETLTLGEDQARLAFSVVELKVHMQVTADLRIVDHWGLDFFALAKGIAYPRGGGPGQTGALRSP